MLLQQQFYGPTALFRLFEIIIQSVGRAQGVVVLHTSVISGQIAVKLAIISQAIQYLTYIFVIRLLAGSSLFVSRLDDSEAGSGFDTIRVWCLRYFPG